MQIDNAISLLKIKAYKNYDGKRLSSFQSGGKVKYVLYPSNIYSLLKIIDELKENDIKYKILGNGTNTLISDSGYSGAIIKLTNFNDIEIYKNIMVVGGGVKLQKIINTALLNNLIGVERLTGIPATIGGAIYNNAGAYGAEISDYVFKIEALSGDNVVLYDKDDLYFNYRGSVVKDKNLIVTKVWLDLNFAPHKDIVNNIKQITKKRKNTQPKERSCGSAFKKSGGVSAGYYLDKLGMKGYRVGGAEISPVHAGFIINRQNATTNDYLTLQNIAKEKVYTHFDVELESEPELVE